MEVEILLNETKECGPHGPLICHKIIRYKEHPDVKIHHSWYAPGLGFTDVIPLNAVWAECDDYKMEIKVDEYKKPYLICLEDLLDKFLNQEL